MENRDSKRMELIKTLHEGHMLSHSGIKALVNRALTTGDFTKLYDYLKKYPMILRQAEFNIQQAEYRELDNPLPIVDRDDASEHLSGPLKFGYVNKHDDMFSIDFDELSLPVIILGRVGGGKSHLNKYCLIQIFSRPRDFNVIIPDLKKEYRNLLSETENIKVLTSNHIRLNPLQVPEWMPINHYILHFAKIFTRENWLITTSENVLISALKYLYKARGIYDGSRNWPTFRDLFNVIVKLQQSKKSFRYQDVLRWIENRLTPYIESDAFHNRCGIPDRIWRDENVILELDEGFSDNMYCFIVSYLAGLRYLYNKKKGLTGSELRTLFNIDEGRILFNANRSVRDFGESYITEIITKTREFGIGFIISSQETASFNQTIRSISYLKIAFPLTDGADIEFIQDSFGLTDDQANYLFKLPRYGQAIVRYGGYENPFILGVPKFRLKNPVTDMEIDERMAGFYDELRQTIKDESASKPSYEINSIPPAALSLLHYLSKEPFTKISDMTNAPGFKSNTEVAKALSWLEKDRLAIREMYKVSKRGRKAHFAVLTQKAYGQFGFKPIPGKGEFEHKLYQHLICQKLKKDGYDAKIEGRIKNSSKSIDVLAETNNAGFIAYEVTLSFDNIIDNIQDDLSAGSSRVVIVARDKSDLRKAENKIKSNPSMTTVPDNLDFCTISDFYS
jgi:Helicase HerA, central domain